MADGFNPQEMIDRFRERADAVKKRNLPAVGGEERRLFIEQAERDFMDFAIIADASVALDDGILTLTINLRQNSDSGGYRMQAVERHLRLGTVTHSRGCSSVG